MVWTLPEEKHIEEKNYLGDWRTNGTGDCEVPGPNGTTLIKIALKPEERIYIKSTRIVAQAIRDVEVANNSEDLVDGACMEGIFSNLAKTIGGETAAISAPPATSGSGAAGSAGRSAAGHPAAPPAALAAPPSLFPEGAFQEPSTRSTPKAHTPVPKVKQTAPLYIDCNAELP